MKKIYSTIITIICFTGTLFAQNKIAEANAAYSNNEYSKAIELYESILKEDGKSATIYYNLGNAYYKNKQYAPAILNYERALLILPNNEDARYNLEMARTHIIDKVNAVKPFFLTTWINNIRNGLSSNGWAYLGVGCFIGFIVCLFLYFFTRVVWIKKVGFFCGLSLICICIISNIFSSDLKEKLLAHNEAIIFAPTITIKSTPSAEGTDVFVLHEGTKVSVISTLSGWGEIEVDGNRGWIPLDKMEII
ncbi:MAG: tetratricopeptide repeat protein [Bacteroidaceae bacterium]|nr:tetratricopeptide repeat protein [Bacteroidaceae bacterium]